MAELSSLAELGTVVATQQPAAPAAPAAPSPLTPEIISHLQSLAQLRDAGILTEEEFQQQKARILNG